MLTTLGEVWTLQGQAETWQLLLVTLFVTKQPSQGECRFYLYQFGECHDLDGILQSRLSKQVASCLEGSPHENHT